MKARIFMSMLVLGLCSAAHAGQYANQMARCMADNISPEENRVLAQWVFAGLAANPAVRNMSNISAQQGDALNRKVAALFVDLKDHRCQKETRQTLQFEGRKGTSAVFGALMQSVIDGLSSDPAVGQFLGGIDQYANPPEIEK